MLIRPDKSIESLCNQNQPVAMKESSPQKPTSRLHLKTADGIQFIRFEDIIRIEADDKKIKVFVTSSPVPITGTGKMEDIEIQLDATMFFRCHRSHIISLQHIEKYIPKGKGCPLVTAKGSVPLAESKTEQFKKSILKNI